MQQVGKHHKVRTKKNQCFSFPTFPTALILWSNTTSTMMLMFCCGCDQNINTGITYSVLLRLCSCIFDACSASCPQEEISSTARSARVVRKQGTLSAVCVHKCTRMHSQTASISHALLLMWCSAVQLTTMEMYHVLLIWTLRHVNYFDRFI